jgi:hypothetical protein
MRLNGWLRTTDFAFPPAGRGLRSRMREIILFTS